MAKTKASGEPENGDKPSPPETTVAQSQESAGVPVESDNISTRVGARTKKAKVVFDPSDNYVPRKRVRKSDLASPDSPTVLPTVKSDPIIPKSPVKLDKSNDNNNGTLVAAAVKPRLPPSPTVVPKQQSPSPVHTFKANTIVPTATRSPDVGRLPVPPIVETPVPTNDVRKPEFKREPNCDMCHKVEQQRRGFKLIDCSSCAFRAHSKCLRAHPVYSKFPIQLNFRCFQCIECVVCGKSLRGGNLLFCCDCQNAFHQNCHGPSTTESSGPWICKRCTSIPVKQSRSHEKRSAPPGNQEPQTEVADDEAHQDFAGFSDNEIRKDSFSLSDGGTANDSSSQQNIKEELDDENEEAENDIDDGEEKFDARLDNFDNVQNWTCDDVYRYFKHYFPDYAHLFKEQEIDGPSLVLMRKSDVLSGFGLKLGPAISLYQRIVMMQNNDRDFRLTWI